MENKNNTKENLYLNFSTKSINDNHVKRINKILTYISKIINIESKSDNFDYQEVENLIYKLSETIDVYDLFIKMTATKEKFNKVISMQIQELDDSICLNKYENLFKND